MEETDQKDSQKDGPKAPRELGSGVSVLSRLEVISGPTGRRHWPGEVKSRIVAESYSAGVTVSEVARRHELRANQLYLWRRQAREGKLVLPGDLFDGDGPGHDLRFVPAVLEASPPQPPIPAARPGAGAISSGPEIAGLIEIEADGVVVRLSEHTSGQRIGEIACALRAGR